MLVGVAPDDAEKKQKERLGNGRTEGLKTGRLVI
jgi:hypothetical protein